MEVDGDDDLPRDCEREREGGGSGAHIRVVSLNSVGSNESNFLTTHNMRWPSSSGIRRERNSVSMTLEHSRIENGSVIDTLDAVV